MKPIHQVLISGVTAEVANTTAFVRLRELAGPPVSSSLFQALSGGCDYQLAVFHSAQAQYSIGQVSYRAAAASHNNHFQAVVMVQMNVRRGEDLAARVVLCLHQLLRQIRAMMIVNDRQGSDDLSVLLDLHRH
jgi:hypothetical protein